LGNRQQTGIETERFVDRREVRFWSITIGDGKHPNGMVPNSALGSDEVN
jgi:hypothetical protein